MSKIQFNGRIFPMAVAVNASEIPSLTWNIPETSKTVTIGTAIEDSKITQKCEIEQFNPTKEFIFVYMRAFDTARAIVDLAGFKMGLGTTTILDSYTINDGPLITLASHDARLSKLCTAYQLGNPSPGTPNEFDQVVRITMQDWRIFFALRDLLEAITVPHVSPINCARSIERLRHIVAPNQPKGQAWGELSRALRVDSTYLKYITDASLGPRHGDPAHVPPDITQETVRRSWIVMNRFLEYKKRGDQLPEASFPLLAG